MPQARAAARRALELEPELAEGHAVTGSIAFYHDWDWETARRELERAMDLNPGLANAYQAYGDYLEVLGRWSESIAVGKRSVEVDPISAGMRMNLGLTYNMARESEEALAACDSALELDPQVVVGLVLHRRCLPPSGSAGGRLGCSRTRGCSSIREATVVQVHPRSPTRRDRSAG